MKYYKLVIFTDGTGTTYQKITAILGVEPVQEDEYGVWTYLVEEQEESPSFDFINRFLDLLEPHFEKLKEVGVTKDDLLFWLLYEYEYQCALGFSPQELHRLGVSGIALNIDSWEAKK
jgi:hypothetical protein